MNYVQPEGFHLMRYASEDGSVAETIWNSRNAVTPFIIHARDAARTEMRHVDWRGDVYAPHHVPKIGDRIFVNLTIEKAREYRRAYVRKWWAEEHMDQRWPTEETAVEELAQSDYRSFGAGTSPDLVEVTEGVLADLISRRPVISNVARSPRFA